MDKATPTPSPASVDKQAALVAKLRYMGKQYAAGQVARGGAPQKHYLEEAADEIEMMAWALSMNTKTPASAQENADLRNVIQAACIDGLPGLARAWEKYFPDHPISIKGAEVERLAAQAAPTEAEALRHLMGMGEAEIDAELLTSGIDPDDAVKRAVRAIDGALAIKAERRAIMYGDIVHNHVCAMRAAVVASHLESPEAGMRWIVNTLFGPGHLPDVDEAIELGGAQAMFDKEMAEHEAFRAAHPAPVAAQPSQAPVVQAMKATSEPLQRYTLRRPKDAADYMAKDSDGQWVKYDDLKADRASSGATPADVRMLREALQGFVDFHTKPAGVTVEIITEKDIFLQAMADIDAREKKLVAAAIDVLAGGA